jgi:structural maintenance of chromosome 3 (chondroitin sulfate proteoglycan 6)
LDTAQTKLDALYAKQGRSDRFPDAESRDAFLASEITSLEAALVDAQADLARQRAEVTRREQKAEQVVATRREREREAAECKVTVEDRRAEVERLRVEINAKQEQRK